MQTKTLSERIAEIQRASQLETFGFKTDPRNETAEKIILEFLKSQKWVAQKSIEIIEELQAENQALLAKNRELEENGWLPMESAPKDQEILVYGGQYDSDLSDPVNLYLPMLVKYEKGYREEDEGSWVAVHTCYYNVTALNPSHWMPLPKPPTKTKGE